MSFSEKIAELKLTPPDGIQVWIDAYTTRANGPHFMGHGRIVQLLREYLAVRNLLAQGTLLPQPVEGQALPTDRLNLILRGDPSWLLAHVKENSVFDAGLLEDVFKLAKERASQLALPAGPVLDGWKLVPVQPTAEMHAKGGSAALQTGGTWGWVAEAAYAAMLDAAPHPPASASPAVAQPVADERKRVIGWRTEEYLYETADPVMAKNWEGNVRVLPIFEGDPNTKLVAPPAEEADKRDAERWRDAVHMLVGNNFPHNYLRCRSYDETVRRFDAALAAKDTL